jgi:hypothetical protein
MSRTAPLARIALSTTVLASVLAFSASVAEAEEESQRTYGIGYRAGNGLGLAGVDATARWIPHVAVDLQLAYAADSTTGVSGHGFGVSPMIQGDWRSAGHSPYIGAGYVYKYEWFKADAGGNSTGRGNSGFFFNAGYKLRFSSGISALLGIGVIHMGDKYEGIDNSFFTVAHGWYFNWEAGLQYFF